MKNNTGLIVAIVICLLILGVLILLLLRPWEPAPAAPVETTEATLETTGEILTTETEPVETEPLYVPEIYPDTVGLYIPAEGSRDRVKVMEFVGVREAKKDIDCFEAFAASDERLPGAGFAQMWKTAWDAHENTENAKIGYAISFTLSDGTEISQVIRKPGDAASFREYLEIYIYDDINQTPGVYYTHIEDSQITDSTVLSSIKLTCGSRIDQVGDIYLTAFIYNGEDCFDGDGNYIGKVSQTIVIKEG